jgi:uncharacterized protein (TIGR03790 family)
MDRYRRWRLSLGLFCACAAQVWAGGSGLNVAVVVNQNSTNSVELGNYYCERRQVPPQNLLRMNWPGGSSVWSNADFNTYLLNPLLTMLSSRNLTNQIDYVVLSMDIPYRVVQNDNATNTGINSTTSCLYYGFKPDFDFPSYNPASCNLPAASSNSYAASEAIFRLAPPATAVTTPFLTMMLTASNLTLAKATIDQGVAGDGTFPPQPVYLAKSDDRLRNIRYLLYDNAIFNTRLHGGYSLLRTSTDVPDGLGILLGYQNGMYVYSSGPGLFAPGAMADNLTSYGGVLYELNDQTTLLMLMNSGATASYGTVVEPCTYFEKFPSPQNYFYQARGFSVAECYYQSVTNPYQGLLVGEPLAAPFAQPAFAAWNSLPVNALLTGTTNLSLQASAGDIRHPVQQVDLFVDGIFVQTLTNIPPSQSNVLTVTLNAQTTNYTVPAGANIGSVATGLADAVNHLTNAKVQAFAHGDRIEFQSTNIARTGTRVPPLSVSYAGATAPALTTYLTASGSNLLDTIAFGERYYFITNTPKLGDYLQLVAIKTNGTTVIVTVTNTVSTNTLATFARSLFDAVNTNPALNSADGLAVEDINMHEDYPFNVYIYGLDDHSGEFNLRALSPGWPQSQIQVCISGSPTFGIQPGGTNRLDPNAADLEPRGHLYVTAGVTNLALSFAVDTTSLADGYHELTAVVYEGSHVHTQKRLAQTVRIQNTALAATFTSLFGGSNTVLGSTLQFSVVANTNNISRIELFSTGGSQGSVVNQSSALFSVAGTDLGLGLHPFYALVTTVTGKQYRTETKWVRLVGPEPPFPLTLRAPPPLLSWPATAGRGYEILSATSLAGSFQVRASVAPTNSFGQWLETNFGAAQRFYRVRATN